MITPASHTWVGRATLSPALRQFRAPDPVLDLVQTLAPVLVRAPAPAPVQARDQVQVLPSGLSAVA